MKAELKSKEKSVAKFEIVVDYNTFNEKVNEVYKKNRSYFTIPGFRRGKGFFGISFNPESISL